MVKIKGASVKFASYSQTVPKFLDILKVSNELKKYDKIVLKVNLSKNSEQNTPVEFVESVLQYCLKNKNPVAEIYIAEGSDGFETSELYDSLGYKKLAETYNIGLIDLNNTETEEVKDDNFTKFESVKYPKILLDSFIISLPKLSSDTEILISASLSNMLGAYPSAHYKGFFTKQKSRIKKWALKYSINDIVACKMPNLAIIDASSHGNIIVGVPFEVDKQASKLLGLDYRNVPYLRLIEENIILKQPISTEEKI